VSKDEIVSVQFGWNRFKLTLVSAVEEACERITV